MACSSPRIPASMSERPMIIIRADNHHTSTYMQVHMCTHAHVQVQVYVRRHAYVQGRATCASVAPAEQQKCSGQSDALTPLHQRGSALNGLARRLLLPQHRRLRPQQQQQQRRLLSECWLCLRKCIICRCSACVCLMNKLERARKA